MQTVTQDTTDHYSAVQIMLSVLIAKRIISCQLARAPPSLKRAVIQINIRKAT